MPLGNLWGFTLSGKKIRIGEISYVPTSLLISGNWGNPQYVGSPVDYTGLTFTVTSAEGITETVTPTSVSPSVWSDIGTQTVTFTYIEASGSITATKSASVLNSILSSISITTPPTRVTYNQGDTFDASGAVVTALWDNGNTTNVTSGCTWSPSTFSTVGSQIMTVSYTYGGVTKTDTMSVTVRKIPETLTVGGSWTNTQYTNTAPDVTGLTYTCNYSDGSSSSVAAILTSPSTWSLTPGTQTATFSYTEDGVTLSTSKNATIYRKLTSLTVSGSWTNTQYTGQAPDTTGLTFTANYNNGTSATVTPTVSPTTWSSTVGTQTATFSYTENGISVSASKTADVEVAPVALRVDGNLTNPQIYGEAPDLTELTFTAIYTLPSNDLTEIDPSTYTQIGPQEVTFRYVDGELVAETSKKVDVDSKFSVALNNFKVDTTATSITALSNL